MRGIIDTYFCADTESSLSELRRGIQNWSNGYETVAKMSAVEGAKELAAKLEGKPLDEIFKEETLNKLRYVH